MSERPTNKQIELWVNEKFTKKQIEIYSLIHPDLGGMSVEDAAEELGITVGNVYARLANMKKRYPPAFRFETITTEIEHDISNSNKDRQDLHMLGRIIAKSKKTATKYKIPYDLSDEDYLDIVRNPCLICNKEGEHDGITKDGRHFKYNYLMLRSFEEGFNYCNCYPVCEEHQKNKSWKNLQRFSRMGF